MIHSSCSTSAPVGLPMFNYLVIRHERGKKEGSATTTKEHIRFHLSHIYCVTINKVMMTTFNTLEVITLALPIGTIGSIVYLLPETHYQ